MVRQLQFSFRFLTLLVLVVGVFQDSSEGTPSQFPVKLVTSPFVTPQLFAEYYEIPNYFTSNYKATGNSQSVVEFGGQYYSPDDLSRFFGNMSLPNTLASVVGTNDASTPGDEATLDIEWIMAVGTEIDTVFWSVDVGYLLEWAQQLLSATNSLFFLLSLSIINLYSSSCEQCFIWW